MIGSPARERRWTEIRAGARMDWRELVAYREVALLLAIRELKARYKQTALGMSWAVLQPVAAAAILSAVFGRLADVPSDGVPYPLFVLVGTVVWTSLTTGVQAAADSLVEDRDLVTKVYFPRLLAPIAAVLPPLVDLSVSLVVVAVAMVVYGVAPTPALVTLPLWMAATAVVALAVGVWASALYVRFRDIRHVLTFGFQLWLFASPVVYATSIIPARWSAVFSLNPAVGLLEGFRWATVGAAAPPLRDLASLAAVVVVGATGLRYFLRAQRRFADVI